MWGCGDIQQPILIQPIVETKNLILDLSLPFALEIIDYFEILENNRKYVIANQLLKSGTSIGANILEAQSAESKADFVHKLKIADKEANETEYWLVLCKMAERYPSPTPEMVEHLKSIKNVVSKIIISFRKDNSHPNSQ
jgi:four helix bundle protein